MAEAMLPKMKSIGRILAEANRRARHPAPGGKGRPSTTPSTRWLDLFDEEIRIKNLNEQVADDLETLLASVAEKRRLTVDWRGGMMNNAQLIKATAKRVGLAPPDLFSDKESSKKA